MSLNFSQLVRALVKRPNQSSIARLVETNQSNDYSTISVAQTLDVEQLRQLVRRFNKLHLWNSQHWHPCFSQMIGLPSQIDVLLDKRFPFPLLGLVHIENKIISHQPMILAETVLRVNIGAVRLHSKGFLIDVHQSAYQYNQLCSSSVSVYLYRFKHGGGSGNTNITPTPGTMPTKGKIFLSSDVGRKYASLSGDYNFIHLYPWLAKVFGFRTTIAHGMHTLSLLISKLPDKELQAVKSGKLLHAHFYQPVFLPAELLIRGESTYSLINPKLPINKEVVLTLAISDKT